jgi:rhodanese-related sulfurtransferase
MKNAKEPKPLFKPNNMKTTLFFITFLALTACTQAQSSSKQVINQSVADFKKTISNKKVQLIDVRRPDEFAEGAIAGASNLNVQDDSFKTLAAQLDRKKPVAVYCRSGVRGTKASNILAEMGFKKIYHLEGGYLAWTK